MGSWLFRNCQRREYREALLELVNKYREKNGLNSLEENDYLNEMAQIRAEELSIRYSHLRPNGKLISGNGINGREFDS